MKYWLFKSEPDDYSIRDLATAPEQTAKWDGIRNYQARNFLRDQVSLGDHVLFYHSQCKHIGIVGTAEIVRAAYPDPAQFDENSKYFDPKASFETPRWFCVDIKHQTSFKREISLARLKANPALAEMVLLKQGRLSVQPVTEQEWQAIMAMAER